MGLVTTSTSVVILCFQWQSFGTALAIRHCMILLIWASERGRECALAIENALHESVKLVGSLREATEQLRLQEYSAVILDQCIADVEPEPTGVLFEHLGPAVPVFVNFAVSGVERVLREVRAAVTRRGRELIIARHAARRSIRNELSDDVTALLLCCGVAISEPGLTETARARILQIHQLVERLRSKLAAVETNEAAAAES